MYTYMLITLASIGNNKKWTTQCSCWLLEPAVHVYGPVVSQEKRLSQHDMAGMSAQRQALLDRLADFEATNRTLRAMLRERHEEEAACLRLAEQRDLLLKKLTETEARVEVHVHALCWTQVCIVLRWGIVCGREARRYSSVCLSSSILL